MDVVDGFVDRFELVALRRAVLQIPLALARPDAPLVQQRHEQRDETHDGRDDVHQEHVAHSQSLPYTMPVMKWILAASQLACLVSLQWRRADRHLPAFRWFLCFAILSSVTYAPWDVRRFEWMSVPSVLLRTAVLLELVALLIRGRYESLRSLVLAASTIGGLIALSFSWAVLDWYSPGVSFAVYSNAVLGGMTWVLLGCAWIFTQPDGWRTRYGLLIGAYFGLIGIAGHLRWYGVTFPVAISLYVVIFCALSKQFLKLRERREREHY